MITKLRNALLAVAVVAVVWEAVGKLRLVGDGAFPPISDIVRQFWKDRHDYPPHVAATTKAAATGFVIGVIISIICALIFSRVPVIERLFRGVGVTLFAVPLIAVVPVLLIAFDGTTPRVILAAMAVYYPTMVSTLAGLRQVDPRLMDVIRASGGDDLDVLRWVRLRAALPSTLSGLRVAAPAALLGALLVEFGGGARWGLGSYLLASLGRALPKRIWSIGLVSTVIASIAYALFSVLAARAGRAMSDVSTATATTRTGAGDGDEPIVRKLAFGVASAGIVIGLWALTLELLDISPVVAKTPAGVVRYLLTGTRGSAARTRLLKALGQTLPISFLGLACGLGSAFVLAVVFTLRPKLGRAVLPFALVSQTMPLSALTPILVLVFGRSILAMVMVTISVTFFPSFVTILQGLAQAPPGPSALVEAYGGGQVSRLRYVAIPNAAPQLLTACRLAAPRALLGVMIAEYLATGTGLGNLLNESRGRLEYGMIWTVAAVAVLVAVSITMLVQVAERAVEHRRVAR